MAAVGRIRWSWLYAWVLLWMASLTIPYFLLWQLGTDPVLEEGTQIVGLGVQISLVVATVALGFVIGWQRRWGMFGVAVVLGALVMSVGGWIAYENGWVGGDPLPEPGPFLGYCVLLGVQLGVGALLGVLANGARHRLSDRRAVT